MDRYRADNVGSLLRPRYLQDAREQYAAGRLSTREFKGIEDRAVNDISAEAQERKLGLVVEVARRVWRD